MPQAARTSRAVQAPCARQPRTSSSVTAWQMQTYMGRGPSSLTSPIRAAPGGARGKAALNKVRHA
ncbi:hypothetical protein Acsp04_23460 [Actinomadura sp. NBRC 104425]|nr:hypothetical protein Acsp04_23460 [Actinomadura sp. NBRC 104425]